jgi:hypothetical protein
MTATALQPVTPEELKARIEKEGPNKIDWDYNSEIDKTDLKEILEADEGLETFQESLLRNNDELLFQQREATLKEILEGFGERPIEGLDPEASDHEKLEHIREISEEIMFDCANIQKLAKHSRRGYFTIRAGEPTTFQSCQGIRYLEDVAEICTILNISPHKLQSLVPESVDLVLPHIPERDGQEYVDSTEWARVLNETMYGGEIVFLCGMQVEHVLENLEAFKKGSITVHKGTRVMMNDYLNGCASMEDTPLLKDITFAPGTASLYLDSADSCGVQECLNATEKIWKPGYASAELPEDPSEKTPE